MTTQLLARLDQNACGTGLFVKDGAQILTTLTNNLDIHRACFADLPAVSGTFEAEVFFWSTSQLAMTNMVSFGVAQSTAGLDKYVGEEAVSWGWRVADGRIDNAGASVQAMTVQPERVALGLVLTLSPGSATLQFRCNGSAVGTAIALPTNKSWLFAITIGNPGTTASGAGDINAYVNFGQSLGYATTTGLGWRQQAPGAATLYLSTCTEAFMSANTDTPANQYFSPDILKPKEFYVTRAPVAWVHRAGSAGGAPTGNAYAPLLLDDSKGKYSALVGIDTKDSVVVIQALSPPGVGGSGTLGIATTVFTGVIDTITKPDLNTVQINVKDQIAALDVPMPMRLVLPFADASSAGRVVPWGVGVQRNVTPLLFDQTSNTYLIGDIVATAVPYVTDMGAQLDPGSAQYTPTTLFGCAAIQTAVAPQGKLSIDYSTVGTAGTVPGNVDVLAGIGAFTTWTSGVPNGWALPGGSTGANGSITQTSAYGTASAMLIQSKVPWAPTSALFGYTVRLATAVLQPGRTYNISLKLLASIGGYAVNGGLMLMCGLSASPLYSITPNGIPIGSASGLVPMTFQFTVPSSAVGLQNLYVSCANQIGGAAGSGSTWSIVVDDITVELLGQFVATPLQGATLNSALLSILVDHAGKSSTIFNTADALIVHAGNEAIGTRWTDQPNIVDAIQELLDTWCAVMFTDATGQIRFRRLTDPSDPSRTSVALLDKTNVNIQQLSNYQIAPDLAIGLTTQFGARRNWNPFSTGDFVTDTAAVTQSMRNAYQQVSQFLLRSKANLAAEYSFANGAPRFESLCDIDTQAQALGDAACGIYAGRNINGVFVSGKRQLVSLMCNYDGLNVGAGPSTAAHQVFYNDVVTINIPERGFVNAPGAVISTTLYPFDRRLGLQVLV